MLFERLLEMQSNPSFLLLYWFHCFINLYINELNLCSSQPLEHSSVSGCRLVHDYINLFLCLSSAHLAFNHNLEPLGLGHPVDLLLLVLAVGVDGDDAERLAVPQAQQRLALALHHIYHRTDSLPAGSL